MALGGGLGRRVARRDAGASGKRRNASNPPPKAPYTLDRWAKAGFFCPLVGVALLIRWVAIAWRRAPVCMKRAGQGTK